MLRPLARTIVDYPPKIYNWSIASSDSKVKAVVLVIGEPDSYVWRKKPMSEKNVITIDYINQRKRKDYLVDDVAARIASMKECRGGRV